MADLETKEPIREDAGGNKSTFHPLGVYVLAYLAFSLLLPIPRFHTEQMRVWEVELLTLIPTAVFMLLQVGLTRALVATRLSLRQSLIAAFVSLALWAAVLFLLHAPRHGSASVRDYIFLTKGTLLGLFLTVALAYFGTLLARIVHEPNMLLPVALVSMPVDYIGAMTSTGFTNMVVKHAPNVVQAVSVQVPAISGAHSLGPIAFIGPGDALFLGFFFAVVQNFKLNEKGTFWWIYGLLTAAMLMVILFSFPIAALVPMGLAVLIANWRYFHLKREEVFAIVYACAFVLAIVCGFYAVSHRYLFHGK